MIEEIARQSNVPMGDSDPQGAPPHGGSGQGNAIAASFAPPLESTGRILAQAREKQGMSVGDVARSLRLGAKQVEALEADDYASLPERTFVRGFIRNYARLVHLDFALLEASSFFGSGPEESSRDIQAPSQQISFSEHRTRPWMKIILAAFVVVALLSWSVLEWLGPEQDKQRTTASKAILSVSPVPAHPAMEPQEVPEPEPEAPAPAQPPAVSALPPVVSAQPAAEAQPSKPSSSTMAQLALDFSGPAWVEVRDKNGQKIHSRTNPAGTQQTLEGEPPLSLVIGSAPNVKMIYKGQPVDLGPHTKADVARLTLE